MRLATLFTAPIFETHGLNQFFHCESVDLPIKFPRMNQDTIYSFATIDTHTGPVQISLPKSDRYMSVACINQDHYMEHYSQEWM